MFGLNEALTEMVTAAANKQLRFVLLLVSAAGVLIVMATVRGSLGATATLTFQLIRHL